MWFSRFTSLILGGLFYVPLMINILNFEFKDAVPISKSFILTKNTLMLIYYLKKQHPFYKINLLNLNNIVQILPSIYVGISIGYIFYIILPTIILSSVFFLVIGFLVFNVFKKTYEKFLNENEMLKNNNRSLNSINTKPQFVKEEFELNIAGEEEPFVKSSISKESLQNVENFHSDYFYIYKLSLCAMSIVTFLTFLLLNGSSSAAILNIKVCSSSYWLIYLAGIIIQMIIAVCISVILNRETRYMLNNNLAIGVVKFNYSNCMIFIGLGFTVGLISITFGLAGGFMANPFFIMIGFDPLISVATATGIMEISSSSSLFKFIVNGNVQYDYALFFCFTLIISTLIGMYILNKVLDNFKRTSFISFGMGCILALACGNMIYHVVTQIKTAESFTSLFQFNDYCATVLSK